MARLIVCYDIKGDLNLVPRELATKLGLKQAALDVPDGIEGKDIYRLARQVAELLLEQV